MIDIDLPAFLGTNKALIICFIMAILFENAYFIFTIIRKGECLYKPKSLIMISMAIGDIFLALFPMIVIAKVLFEGQDFSLPCSTARASTVYLKFFINFVYGFGLITMAVELVNRYRTQQAQEKTINNIAKSFVFSAVPWLLGLIIVLPLTYAHINNYGPYIRLPSEGAVITPYLFTCFQSVINEKWLFQGVIKEKWLSMFGVSVLLPAALAVVVCITIMCVRLLPARFTAPAVVTYQSPVQPVVITTQNTNMSHAATIPQYPVSNGVGVQQYPTVSTQGTQQYPTVSTQGTQQYPTASTQGTQQYPSDGISATPHIPTAPPNDKLDPSVGGPVFTPQATQYPAQQYPPPPYPGQQYPPPQYLPPQYHVQQYPPAYYPVQQYNAQSNMVVAGPAYVVQAQNPALSTLPDPGREKNALLVVSIVYAFCVVPMAIFSMGTWDTYYFDNLAVILDASFFWLAIFRSLITPFIFIRYNRQQ